MKRPALRIAYVVEDDDPTPLIEPCLGIKMARLKEIWNAGKKYSPEEVISKLRGLFPVRNHETFDVLQLNEDLAFESGLHQTYVSGIERGTRNLTIVAIEVLAIALSVKPAALFAGWQNSKKKG